MKDKLSRREFLKEAVIFVGAAAIFGCTPPYTNKEKPQSNGLPGGISTLVPPNEVQDIPEAGTSPESNFLSPAPVPEVTPTLPPGTYPRSSEGFLPVVNDEYKNLPLDEALKKQSDATLMRFGELGLSGEVDSVKALYVDELMRKYGISQEAAEDALEFEYHINEGKSWLAVAKVGGRYLMPVITDASCGGGTGRKIDPSMATTLGRPECQGDFFDLELLESAQGLGNTRQVILKDQNSGWFAFGEASVATKETYTWYDMKKERSSSWTPADSFRPQGAASVRLDNDQWVALKTDGAVGWRFDSSRQEWVDTAPKNFRELIDLKTREFEQKTGQNLLEAMAPHEGRMIGWREIISTTGEKLGYTPNVFYGGFYVNEEKGLIRKPWSVNTEYLNLGSGRLPLEGKVPGAKEGDFAVVIVGSRLPDPELGQTEVQFMPLIVGASLNGKWEGGSVSIADAKGTLTPYENSNTPQGLENVIEDNYAEPINATSIIRLQNMEDLNGVLYETTNTRGDVPQVFKTLMAQMENGYVRRFTDENGPLGQIVKGHDGRFYGGEPTLEELFDLLGTDDLGLFSPKLRFYN